MAIPFRWYVVHVFSGFEKKVCESIAEQAEKKGIADQFDQLLVPSETVKEVRRGKTYDSERKFFPGYIIVRMKLSDEAWNLVKNTARVTDFLGMKGKPIPISEREAQTMLQQMQEGTSSLPSDIVFEVGENVEVKEGPFATFQGIVEAVDPDKQVVTVSVSIFGRATPVELTYNQVEKRG